MASRTVQIYTSDLTGKEIGDASKLVEVRVLDHRDLDRAVRLDAYALEVQSLFDTDGQFVTLEVVVPGQPARRLVGPNDVFDKVFTSDVTEALAAAETYSPAGADVPTLHARPARSTKQASPSSMSREQRDAVRDWANNHGYTVVTAAVSRPRSSPILKPPTTDKCGKFWPRSPGRRRQAGTSSG